MGCTQRDNKGARREKGNINSTSMMQEDEGIVVTEEWVLIALQSKGKQG